MNALLPALASLAGPILARVLLALGFSVVAVGGVGVAINQITDLVLSKLSAAPMIGLQLAGLAGVWEGLGMVLGSVTFTLALWSLTKAVRIVKG